MSIARIASQIDKKKFLCYQNYLIGWRVFTILNRKVQSTQVAIGGSINYPPGGTPADLICLPSLWFQQVWKSLKPSSDGILSLDDLSHNGFTKFNKNVKPFHAKIIVKVCHEWHTRGSIKDEEVKTFGVGSSLNYPPGETPADLI